MEDFRELARGLIPGKVDEEKFDFYAKDVEQYVCAYCGVTGIPEGCGTVAAQMLAAAYLGEMEGKVKAVSRGDTRVKYSEQGKERFASFDLRLNAFRKLRWQ